MFGNGLWGIASFAILVCWESWWLHRLLHQKYSCRVARLTLNEYGADPIQEERLAMAMATCVFRYHQTLARKDWRWLWPLVFFEENWYVKEEGSKTPWLLSGHFKKTDHAWTVAACKRQAKSRITLVEALCRLYTAVFNSGNVLAVACLFYTAVFNSPEAVQARNELFHEVLLRIL